MSQPHPESITLAGTQRPSDRWVRVIEVAGRQSGVIGRAQLHACGADESTIKRWIARGQLRRIQRATYAVGRPEVGVRGNVIAGLLYAGPGAALSHLTAGWCWRIVAAPPRRVHVSSTADRLSLPGVCVHRLREIDRVDLDGLPVTPVARTLIDLAATMSFRDLRLALAEADYRGVLDPVEIHLRTERGRAGSAAREVRWTCISRSWHEREATSSRSSFGSVESAGIAPPEVNEFVQGLMVDCLWRDRHLVVELDGAAAHGGAAAMVRDRAAS